MPDFHCLMFKCCLLELTGTQGTNNFQEKDPGIIRAWRDSEVRTAGQSFDEKIKKETNYERRANVGLVKLAELKA